MEEEHEVYGGELPDVKRDVESHHADVDMSVAEENAVNELDEMKKRLKEMEEKAAALREMLAKVEKGIGAVQGKTNKGRGKRVSQHASNSSETNFVSNALKEDTTTSGTSKVDVDDTVDVEDPAAKNDEKEAETANSLTQKGEGDLKLYPVTVKTENGEKFELQLDPEEFVMKIRQFLLHAPATCFITCYEILLHTKDGSTHHLENDFDKISEVADITTGGCSLVIVPALYDDWSIRAHVHRTRELLSLSTLHVSLSKSLALQNEVAQTKAGSAGDAPKIEVPELDGLVYMDDVSGSLGNLLQSTSKETKCLESIVFSSFNPPPSYRSLVGDLIYLDVTTCEGGNNFCITGTTRSFYLNSSTGSTLDPKPAKNNAEANTLVGLLRKINSKFEKAFREILERRGSAHPCEKLPSLLPPNSWLGLHPLPDHKRDSARAEASLTPSYGSELIKMQRDWNDDLQYYREFPHTTPQERILRDKFLYKATSDFVVAAISGAIGVIRRCISPFYTNDPEWYVHNNIVFSFAVDADLEQLPKKCAEVNSYVEQSLDISAESQVAESEQTTYASANNLLRGTKAYQEADVPGLYDLAMAVIDYRGHRIVARSVLPGILPGNESDSLLYGSDDNGKKICWNEAFHAKVVEAAKRLHLKEHTIFDGSGNVFKLAAPVECKGIVGSDDRHYLLDMMRVTPRDANYTGSGSRFCILRPELITAYCQAQVVEASSSKANSLGEAKVNGNSQVADGENQDLTEEKTENVEVAPASHGTTDPCPEILFNPNAFTEFKLAGNAEEIAADEESVRKVSLYLTDIVLPKFIQDLYTLEVCPMDGQTLTEALHVNGINIRYIGKVAEGTKHLPHLWDLCTNEIIVRSAKHIIKDVLRETEDHDLAPTIAHSFNCVFGSSQALGERDQAGHQSSGKGQARWKGRVSSRKAQPSYVNISSDDLWVSIKEFARIKYKFELPDDARIRVKKVPVLRNLCQKVGVSIAARKYDFNSTSPFETLDILDLLPVVKHSVPVCLEAKELVETGKLKLAEGMFSEAFTLFSEAYSILQEVTGPIYRDVANCCRYLAMLLFGEGDIVAAANMQLEGLIINERCLGLDHPETAHSYASMALFYNALNRRELALRHMSRALFLLSLSSGPDHPDVAAKMINVAMVCQNIGKLHRCFEEGLMKNKRLLGEEHIQIARFYHVLAIASDRRGDFKLSYQQEKRAHDILVKQLGEDDSRTRDSQNWMNAQKQKEQALNATSANETIDVSLIDSVKARLKFSPAPQAAPVAGGSSSSGAAFNKNHNAAVLGDSIPRGQGVDESAARVAAEDWIKFLARGVIPPHGVSPQFTQFVDILEAAFNKNHNADKDQSALRQAEQPPAGLGIGLPKKQKAKSKAAA